MNKMQFYGLGRRLPYRSVSILILGGALASMAIGQETVSPSYGNPSIYYSWAEDSVGSESNYSTSAYLGSIGAWSTGELTGSTGFTANSTLNYNGSSPTWGTAYAGEFGTLVGGDSFGRSVLAGLLTGAGYTAGGYAVAQIYSTSGGEVSTLYGMQGFVQEAAMSGDSVVAVTLSEGNGYSDDAASITAQIIAAPGVSAVIDPSGTIGATYSSATDSVDISFNTSASAYRGDEIFSALGGDEGASIYSDDAYLRDNLYVVAGGSMAAPIYIGSFGYGLISTGTGSADYASWAAGQGALSQELNLTSGGGSYAVSLSELSALGLTGPLTFEMDQLVYWDGYGGDIGAGPQLIAESMTQTNLTASPVPEPVTTALGIAGVGLAIRRRNRSFGRRPG